MTTSQPQYPAAAFGANPEADEQLPVFPEDRDARTDTDGEPVGEADRDEDVRRAGGDPDTI